ncbi:MAG: hypothetical protein N2643_03525, partial [Endomicrobia bacterium]|nr:hypothetical protein [Endomicrobiia bacterium]
DTNTFNTTNYLRLSGSVLEITSTPEWNTLTNWNNKWIVGLSTKLYIGSKQNRAMATLKKALILMSPLPTLV